MYNFFVESNSFNDNNVIINGNDYNHIKNVLRMSIGNKIQVCNKESGEGFLCEIDRIDNEIIVCNIIKKIDSNESNIKVSAGGEVDNKEQIRRYINYYKEGCIFLFSGTPKSYTTTISLFKDYICSKYLGEAQITINIVSSAGPGE